MQDLEHVSHYNETVIVREVVRRDCEDVSRLVNMVEIVEEVCVDVMGDVEKVVEKSTTTVEKQHVCFLICDEDFGFRQPENAGKQKLSQSCDNQNKTWSRQV